ncbi:putative reverse transcriptase domain-containing protein [Tanacetum coccineum]
MYASRQLKIHDKNYTTHGLELSAVVFTLKIWKHVLVTSSKAWSAYVDHLRSWWKIYFAVLVDIAEGIGNTDKHVVEVGDEVMLEVSFWKDVVHFGKKDMLAPRYKFLANANLHVLLDEIKIDKTLRFVEEPVEIMDREVRSLKRSKISLVKVHWNSKRGLEFTWEREDHMKSKYPQLFIDRAVESDTVTIVI